MPFVHLERELWDLRDGAGAEIGLDAPERGAWLTERGAVGRLRPDVEQLLADPAEAADAAWAAADMLHVAARALRDPHLRCAADSYDRAARALDEVITVLAERAPDLAEAQNRRHHPRRPRPHPLRAQLHHMKFVEITSMSRGV